MPLLLRAYVTMLKYWNRIRTTDNSLVKLTYKENVKSNNTRCKTLQILNTTFGLNTMNWTPTEFSNAMKKRVKSDFITHWKTRVGNPELEKNLRLYAKVKEDFLVGKYLKMPSFRNRQMISKVLCSSHKLRIETGRHTTPITPREERLCQRC